MANKKIAGITVEIGADTTKLGKALDDVNKKSRDIKTELREVDKALQLNPESTELLAQKQRLLAEAITAAKDKLHTLREAQEQVEQQFARGEIDEGQYRAFQREISNAEAELERLEGEADKAGASMSNIGDKFQEVGGKVSDLGEKLLPITKAVTGLGKEAVTTAADFDASMSKVAAISGATGDDLQALRDKAREMGAKTKFSASEAADAFQFMAMAGWKTEDMLGGVAGIMNLAAASGEDLATTSDIVTDALTAFGLTAKDAGHFSDVLTAASSNANTNVSLMGETFKYAAPVAGSLGFSVEDTAQAIGLMANSGIKASQAGTSLRMILSSLAGEIKFCGEELGETTIETTNADGSMRELSDILADCREAFGQLTESEQANNAEAVFGRNAMSGFLALMNAAPKDIEKLDSAIKGSTGTAESMAETMQDNLGGQITILKSQIQELAISFGEIIMPIIRQAVEKIQQITDRLNKLNPATKETILKIAAVAAAIGPVLIIVGKIISGIGTAINLINNVKNVITALNGVLLANPLALIVAAIAAVIAILITLYNNSEAFRNFVDKAFKEFKKWFTEAVDTWKTGIKIIIQFIKDFVDAWKTGIKAVLEFFKNAVDTWKTGIKAIKDAFEAAWTAIKNVWSAAGAFFRSIWEEIKQAFANVARFFGDTFKAGWDAITNIFNQAGAFFRGVWDTITGIFAGVGDFFRDKFNQAWENIKSVFSGIRDFFGGIWDNIRDLFGNVGGAIGDAFSGAFKSTINRVFEWVEEKINSVFDMINGAIDFINDIPGVNIKKVQHMSLPRLAKGGQLTEGAAIVAEAGPELLSVLGGRVTVTPLTQQSKNTALQAAGQSKTANYYQTFNVSATIKNDTDIRTLAQQLGALSKQTAFGKGGF